MINKFEAVGIFASVGLMAVALFLLRVENMPSLVQNQTDTTQQASVVAVVDPKAPHQQAALYDAISEASTDNGELTGLVINDVVIGDGSEASKGDTVTVHYIGTLETGQQFDNSNTRGTPFTFTLGENRVIAGWEQGVLGMKAGGERILVIPPGMAYGNKNVGPIPANSTLVFSISLLSIN